MFQTPPTQIALPTFVTMTGKTALSANWKKLQNSQSRTPVQFQMKYKPQDQSYKFWDEQTSGANLVIW